MVLFLYGDTRNALSIESIMDKLSTPNTFSTAIEEFENVVGHAGESSEHLLDLKSDFKRLSKIGLENTDNQEYYLNPSIFKQLLNLIQELLTVLIEY